MATKPKQNTVKPGALRASLEDTLNFLAGHGCPSLTQEPNGSWSCSLTMLNGKFLIRWASTPGIAAEKCWKALTDYVQREDAAADALPRE